MHWAKLIKVVIKQISGRANILLALSISFIVHLPLLLGLLYWEMPKPKATYRQSLHLKLKALAERNTKEVDIRPIDPPLSHSEASSPTKPAAVSTQAESFTMQDFVDQLKETPMSPSTNTEIDRIKDLKTTGVPGSSTIFDPRLRQKFYGVPELGVTHLMEQYQVGSMHYFELGKGECLREFESGYGQTDKDSEEYLMLNVRKVRCPGTSNESFEIYQGLKNALHETERQNLISQ